MRKTIYILLFIALALTSCKRVVVVVESIPNNTPPGQDIFITGNFNNWEPGNNLFRLNLDKDSNYYFKLPPGFGIIDFKFTRGDWSTVEKDNCGAEIQNRRIGVANFDTVFCNIESWRDQYPINCDHIDIIIDELPLTTPSNEGIALACNLNSWIPNKDYIFKKNYNGKLYLEVKRPTNTNILEYKITRGDMSNAEADEYGNPISNRVAIFGQDQLQEIIVEGWSDKKDTELTDVVLILENIPNNTPKIEGIYLSGSINAWRLKDKNYQFKKNNEGKYYIILPRKRMNMEYKILRKDWGTVETDSYGHDIQNRHLDLRYADTVRIDIQRWKDIW